VTPPGAFCDLFVQLSAAAPPGGMPSPEVFAALDLKYGVTTIGPPMTA